MNNAYDALRSAAARHDANVNRLEAIEAIVREHPEWIAADARLEPLLPPAEPKVFAIKPTDRP